MNITAQYARRHDRRQVWTARAAVALAFLISLLPLGHHRHHATAELTKHDELTISDNLAHNRRSAAHSAAWLAAYRARTTSHRHIRRDGHTPAGRTSASLTQTAPTATFAATAAARGLAVDRPPASPSASGRTHPTVYHVHTLPSSPLGTPTATPRAKATGAGAHHAAARTRTLRTERSSAASRSRRLSFSARWAQHGRTSTIEALSQQANRYVPGGASPRTGFDCSGLTMWAWARAGVHLSHVAAIQYDQTLRIRRSQLQAGDLVFLSYGHGISHVALYIGHGKLIHATSRRYRRQDQIRIDRLSSPWIGHVVGYGRVKP